MEIFTVFNTFIVALVAIFFLFMQLSVAQLQRYLLIAAAFYTVPLLIVLIGSPFSWSEADYMSVILLQRGMTSLIFSIGYGITAGLLLLGFRIIVTSLFFRLKQLFSKRDENTDQSEVAS